MDNRNGGQEMFRVKCSGVDGFLEDFDAGDAISVSVHIAKKLFVSENGYGVYSVETSEYETLTVRGTFPVELVYDGFYTMSGEVIIKDNRKILDVVSYESAVPKSKAGTIRVLNALNGMDSMAHKLYDLCDGAPIEMLRECPEKVFEFSKAFGFLERRIMEWSKSLNTRVSDEESLRFLLSYGLSMGRARRILSAMRDKGDGFHLVMDDPYKLLTYGSGVSFDQIDKIALDNGHKLDSPGRAIEAIMFVYRNSVSSCGHTTITDKSLTDNAVGLMSYFLGYNDARSLLKDYKGKETAEINIGGGRFSVCVSDLKSEFDAWLSMSKDERSPFRYYLFECPKDIIPNALITLVQAGRLVKRDLEGVVYYQSHNDFANTDDISFFLEQASRFASATSVDRSIVEDILNNVLEARAFGDKPKIVLEPEQREAVITACSSCYGPVILTGPAGSGKTFVLGIILDVYKVLYHKVLSHVPTASILAPTGKAAQVASQATGLLSSTIHRHSSYRCGIAPTSDIYVVDEFSMVDESVCAMLVRTLNPKCKLIVIGDTQQLPSVGGGACLRDFINSGCIPHARLLTVKRQALDSGILINANKIVAGEMIDTEIVSDSSIDNNAYVQFNSSKDEAIKTLEKFVLMHGLQSFHNDTFQILLPSNAGELGTVKVNLLCQELLNPYVPGIDSLESDSDKYRLHIKSDFVTKSGRVKSSFIYLHVNDKVINMTNNYNLQRYVMKHGEFRPTRMGVMNGETGVIERIYMVRVKSSLVKRVIVRFDNEYVLFDGDEGQSLMLSYAMTIHKSQGSAWATTLSIIMGDYKLMYTKYLLYTMYTRARKTNFLIGDKDAIESCISNEYQAERTTVLETMIKNKLVCLPPMKGLPS